MQNTVSLEDFLCAVIMPTAILGVLLFIAICQKQTIRNLKNKTLQ